MTASNTSDRTTSMVEDFVLTDDAATLLSPYFSTNQQQPKPQTNFVSVPTAPVASNSTVSTDAYFPHAGGMDHNLLSQVGTMQYWNATAAVAANQSLLSQQTQCMQQLPFHNFLFHPNPSSSSVENHPQQQQQQQQLLNPATCPVGVMANYPLMGSFPQQNFLPAATTPTLLQLPTAEGAMLSGTTPQPFPNFPQVAQHQQQQITMTAAPASPDPALAPIPLTSPSSDTKKRPAEMEPSSQHYSKQINNANDRFIGISSSNPNTSTDASGNTIERSVAVLSVIESSASSGKYRNSSHQKQQNLLINSIGSVSVPALPTSSQAPSEDKDEPKNKIPDLSHLSPQEKRRYERNLREQQRIYTINQHIKELQAVLQESSIPFKPNKISTLMSVGQYIKRLQAHSVYLETEHRKLTDTIHQTTELMNTGRTSESVTHSPNQIGNDSDMLFVQGIDYKSVFFQSSAALGIATLDGRIIDCNEEFEIVSGYSKDELTHTSLFHLLATQDIDKLFQVLGNMLKNGPSNDDFSLTESYWRGVFSQNHQSEDILMNITLARDADGKPKYFICALTFT